jgi:alpha-1,2-mannosyltransferase
LSLGRYRLDLDVYRIASQAWLHGKPLYGALPATSDGTKGLPFSYPPISAVLLSPLSLVPLTVAAMVLTCISVALLAVVLYLFLRSLAGAQIKLRWKVRWLLPAALLLEPTRNTLNYGQINIILMTLVSVDCLYRGPGRTRGALVGIAAAVKLTPLAFILFFLVKKDYRAACVAGITFAACTGVGFLLAWRDSVQYWTSIIFEPGRDGSTAYAANQSIQAVLSRAGINMSSTAGMVLWIGLSLLTVIIAYAGMRRAREKMLDAWAVSLNALAALLISPISWSHHWVWAEPAILALALISWRFRNMAGVAVAVTGTLILAIAPHWLINAKDPNALTWNAWEQIIGSSYVILGFVILVLSATLFRWRQVPSSSSGEPLCDLGKHVSQPQPAANELALP